MIAEIGYAVRIGYGGGKVRINGCIGCYILQELVYYARNGIDAAQAGVQGLFRLFFRAGTERNNSRKAKYEENRQESFHRMRV
jgi:hypothetical protein